MAGYKVTSKNKKVMSIIPHTDPQQEHVEEVVFKMVGYCEAESEGNLKCRSQCKYCKDHDVELKEAALYKKIEEAVIEWSNDGHKTAGTLTRKIMEIINKIDKI